MRSSLKIASLVLLTSIASSAIAQVDDNAQGFLNCSVKNESGDTMYITAADFPGKHGDAKILAQAFADKVIKDFPEAGNLGLPMCNFGFEAKYADMYLDKIKSQFSGDLQTVDFAPAK